MSFLNFRFSHPSLCSLATLTATDLVSSSRSLCCTPLCLQSDRLPCSRPRKRLRYRINFRSFSFDGCPRRSRYDLQSSFVRGVLHGRWSSLRFGIGYRLFALRYSRQTFFLDSPPFLLLLYLVSGNTIPTQACHRNSRDSMRMTEREKFRNLACDTNETLFPRSFDSAQLLCI